MSERVRALLCSVHAGKYVRGVLQNECSVIDGHCSCRNGPTPARVQDFSNGFSHSMPTTQFSFPHPPLPPRPCLSSARRVWAVWPPPPATLLRRPPPWLPWLPRTRRPRVKLGRRWAGRGHRPVMSPPQLTRAGVPALCTQTKAVDKSIVVTKQLHSFRSVRLPHAPPQGCSALGVAEGATRHLLGPAPPRQIKVGLNDGVSLSSSFVLRCLPPYPPLPPPALCPLHRTAAHPPP